MKPILFNAEMVRAILNDQKTATRRVIKPQPKHVHTIFGPSDEEDGKFEFLCGCIEDGLCLDWIEAVKMPYQPGDVLYVRETWQYAFDLNEYDQIIEETGRYFYAADDPVPFNDWIMPDGTHRDAMPWRPSIHMPKAAARLFLQVTDVRVERLQDITPVGLRMEGIQVSPIFDAWDCEMSPEAMRRFEFERIWDNTIKKKDITRFGWNANPWVWVIEFERIDKGEADL